MNLKNWLIENNISYEKLSAAVGSNPRVIHRWANFDIPNSLIVAYNIVKVTNGEVGLDDLIATWRNDFYKKPNSD